jgi:hypothetical protein
MHFFGVQAAVAQQFTGEQQHRNLVAVANLSLGIGIDVAHIDAEPLRLRQCRELREHFLAQTASGPGVQHEAQRRSAHPGA